MSTDNAVSNDFSTVIVWIEHPTEWTAVLSYALLALISIGIGYVFGARRSKRTKRRLQEELNRQSLALLDSKAALNATQLKLDHQPRKDKLLELTLRRLQFANKRSKSLAQLVAKQNKSHFIQLSKLRLRAVESREAALKAAEIARKATVHLRRLEDASPATQTIEAPEPKSYGCGGAVTVSVVDQVRIDSPKEAAAPMTNRDSARLTKLTSSNEPTAPVV